MNKKGQGACFAYTWDGIIRIWVGRVSCHITGRNTKFKNTVFSTGCGAIPECVAFDLPFKQGVRGSSPRWSTKRTATPFGVVVFSCRRGLESSSKAPAGLSSSSAHTGRYLYLRRSPARRKCMRVPAGAPKEQPPLSGWLFFHADGDSNHHRKPRRGFHRPVRTLGDTSICADLPRGANACESPLEHQSNKIRTSSSLWETGSDFVFSAGTCPLPTASRW